MAALRAGICKAMTEHVWSTLQEAKIRTVIDFVARDPEKIAESCSIPYKDILSIRRVLLAQYSAFPLLASQLYSNALSSLSILSTGIAGLDELLDGGLYGEVCEVAGETTSGKTQVCLQCAVTVASTHSQNVLYIDTCGSSSAERLLDFIPRGGQSEVTEEKAQEVLSHIHFITAHDVHSLFSALDDVATDMQTQQTSGFYRSVKLIILDSVAAVFYPVLGGQQMDSVGLLEQLGRRLKQLAMDLSLAVLVTNNVTSGMDGERRPSLGRLWAHVPHTRVILERPVLTSSHSHRTATLVKSIRMTTPSTTMFSLAEDGEKGPE